MGFLSKGPGAEWKHILEIVQISENSLSNDLIIWFTGTTTTKDEDQPGEENNDMSIDPLIRSRSVIPGLLFVSSPVDVEWSWSQDNTKRYGHHMMTMMNRSGGPCNNGNK